MKPPTELTPSELLDLNQRPMEVLRWSENQRAELLELIEAEVAIWETQRSPAQAAWAKKRVGDQIGVARDFVTLQHHLN